LSKASKPTWLVVMNVFSYLNPTLIIPKKEIYPSLIANSNSFGRTRSNKSKSGYKSSYSFIFIKPKNNSLTLSLKDNQWPTSRTTHCFFPLPLPTKEKIILFTRDFILSTRKERTERESYRRITITMKLARS